MAHSNPLLQLSLIGGDLASAGQQNMKEVLVLERVQYHHFEVKMAKTKHHHFHNLPLAPPPCCRVGDHAMPYMCLPQESGLGTVAEERDSHMYEVGKKRCLELFTDMI